MGNFNKIINFVKSFYKKVSKQVNHVEHLAVTKPSCKNDNLGILSKFVIILILIFVLTFIGDAIMKLFSILCLIFVICFILKEPNDGQE